MGLAYLGMFISHLFNINYISIASYLIFYPISAIIFTKHIRKQDSISSFDKKLLISIISLLTVSFLLKLLHAPFKIINNTILFVALSFIIYLNFQKLKQLRNELRWMDLVGLNIILELIKNIVG
jgi:hypothetical protein